MNNLKNFCRFVNENSKAELEALRYLMSLGLLKSPVEEFKAALTNEGDYELWQYDPEVETTADSMVRLRFFFDPEYNFPDLEDDLRLGLGLKADVELSPSITLTVELDWFTGALLWRVEVHDDALNFSEAGEVRSGPDEQYSIVSPDQAEMVLSSIESFIGDGPMVDGRHQTEIYSIILDIYSKKTKRRQRPA